MWNDAIYNMTISELQNKIQEKEKEYKGALKAKKVFYEVKKIVEQKRAMERELNRKQFESN